MKLTAGMTGLKDRDTTRTNTAPLGSGVSQVQAARLPLRTRQRKPGYIALAVVLVVGLAALGGWFYTSAGAKTPVVVVVQQIPAGHVVTREALSTVEVSGGVVAIAGANLGSVIGQTATVDLLPNTLLQRAMVTDGPLLDANQAQVGVQLIGGQLPAGGLLPGDTVQVLRLPDKQASATTSGAAPAAVVLVAKAVVFDTAPDPSSASGTLVTLVVPASAAAGVATASNFGLVALVRVAR